MELHLRGIANAIYGELYLQGVIFIRCYILSCSFYYSYCTVQYLLYCIAVAVQNLINGFSGGNKLPLL
jgi:hypothetical protein